MNETITIVTSGCNITIGIRVLQVDVTTCLLPLIIIIPLCGLTLIPLLLSFLSPSLCAIRLQNGRSMFPNRTCLLQGSGILMVVVCNLCFRHKNDYDEHDNKTKQRRNVGNSNGGNNSNNSSINDK